MDSDTPRTDALQVGDALDEDKRNHCVVRGFYVEKGEPACMAFVPKEVRGE